MVVLLPAVVIEWDTPPVNSIAPFKRDTCTQEPMTLEGVTFCKNGFEHAESLFDSAYFDGSHAWVRWSGSLSPAVQSLAFVVCVLRDIHSQLC